jgi:phosphomannomutase
MTTTIEQRARQWLEWDPNEETRSVVSEMLKNSENVKLEKAFGSRVEFGTAGLRAPMGAGTACLNDLVILQTAQGLASYLINTYRKGEKSDTDLSIVIGYDHRSRGSLNSKHFALITAAACMSVGIKVHLFGRLVATPLVPFAIRKLGAKAGVMVTASHNPKEDNGYKVYWGNGAQIIPPHDAGISSSIESNLEPWKSVNYANVTEEAVRSNSLCSDIQHDQEIIEDYMNTVTKNLSSSIPTSNMILKIAYTAMHGVGRPFATSLFQKFGLPAMIETTEQVLPDPTFPTVAFPNPEEGKGALKLAMATAERNGCSLILANDPDADRLAVAEWDPVDGKPGAAPAEGTGQWHIFTGNEIGALFADWMFTRYVAKGGIPGKNVWMVASTVSSKLIKAMAKVEGFSFRETLTGFKYMGNAMADIDEAGETCLFSFEEAIGFCCGTVVRDKDGVSAAAVFAEMANTHAVNGKTCGKRLDELYEKYGFHTTNNGYVIVDLPSKTEAIFSRLRNEGHYWARLGDLHITNIRDLTGNGLDTSTEDSKPLLPTSQSTQMLTYSLSNGVIATLRTSGTEPKLKFYAEGCGFDREWVKAELRRTVGLIIDEMIEPERYNLKRPIF